MSTQTTSTNGFGTIPLTLSLQKFDPPSINTYLSSVQDITLSTQGIAEISNPGSCPPRAHSVGLGGGVCGGVDSKVSKYTYCEDNEWTAQRRMNVCERRRGSGLGAKMSTSFMEEGCFHVGNSEKGPVRPPRAAAAILVFGLELFILNFAGRGGEH